MSLEISPELLPEYQRCYDAIGPEDPYVGPLSLGIHDVLRAHFLIADFFYAEGEGLGGIGPRDINLLHSALSRQHTGFGGETKWTGKYDLCATLMYGLIMDHPFHDANKRTAFLSALYHLMKLGRCPTVEQNVMEDFTVMIANKDIKRFRQYKELERKSSDPEVLYISQWLRGHTRNEDKRYYAVTYNDLRKILNRFDCDLVNPHGNKIDVVKTIKKKKMFGRGIREETQTIAQIGFPRWTAQVGKGAVSTVRKELKLTHADGYDSQAFFYGLDPVKELITVYQEPLRRLANR